MVSSLRVVGRRSAGEERAKGFRFESWREGEWSGLEEAVELPAAPRAPRGGAGIG